MLPINKLILFQDIEDINEVRVAIDLIDSFSFDGMSQSY